MVVFKSLRL